jgi:hypothetical protein
MKPSILAAFFLAAVSTALPSPEVEEQSSSLNATVLACDTLKLLYSAKVFFPGSANYTAENERKFPNVELDAAVADLQLQTFGRLPITSPHIVFSRQHLHSRSRSRFLLLRR